MIISASRRTDLPAFYGEWFAKRLESGSCLVANPFNPRQVTQVSLRRQDVTAFVFWTRDPRPFGAVLDRLDRDRLPYLFLFTLTGYGSPLEPFAPPVDEAVPAFQRLASRIGPERVVWRYDPIVLGPGLDVEDHCRRFESLAAALCGSTRSVRLSFVDLYHKTCRRLGSAAPDFLTDPAQNRAAGQLLGRLAAIASAHGIEAQTCAEPVDYSSHGVPPGACIDPSLLATVCGHDVPRSKDKGQRPYCRCAPSRDIGACDTCLHGCVYCYATSSHQVAVDRHRRHDPDAPSLMPLAE
jgi:hypothetical protein